jgi:hypothetical protein
MEIQNKKNKQRSSKKSFEISYDPVEKCIVIKVLDMEGMYPCRWHDPEGGIHTIIKKRSGKIQMV